MKRVWHVALAIALMLLTLQAAQAQETTSSESDAQGVKGGIGLRFIPSALSPMSGYYTDPALSTALLVRFWINQMLAIEAGGWAYTYEDAWSKNSNTLITGGVLFKLASIEMQNFYLAGRGIHYTTRSEGAYYYCPYDGSEPPIVRQTVGPDESKPSPIVPPCWPSGGSRSKSTTMALEGTVGAEWKPLTNISLNFEFGLMYAQTVTTNEYPQPVPVPPTEPPVMPVQTPTIETFASSVMSPVMHFEVIFYIF